MSSKRSLLATIVLLAATVSGSCGESMNSERLAAVRDSLGIRILEYSNTPEPPLGDLELVWTYGHLPDEYEFQFVVLGALRGDEWAVVGDMGNQEVVAIDPLGGGHTLLAYSGEGPTEVQRPRAIIATGENGFWVEDGGNSKLMFFRGDSLVSTVSAHGRSDLTRGAMLCGVDPNGRLLMITGSYRPDPSRRWMDGHLTRFDPVTNVLDTVGTYPMGSGRVDEGANPFPPYGVVSCAGGGFVHARTDIPALTWRTSDGNVSKILRWEPNLVYPTDSIWARFESSLRADLRRVNPQMSGDQLEEFVNRSIARYSVDPSVPLPLFGPLFGGPSGEVWLSDYPPGNTWPSAYTVVSGDGEWVGRLEFPGPFYVLDIRGGMALGVVTDDLDVQALALYRYRVGS